VHDVVRVDTYLKSRMTRKCLVRFGSGRDAGDCLLDHDWAVCKSTKYSAVHVLDWILRTASNIRFHTSTNVVS